MSETGHTKNVANFERLIAIVSSFGPSYRPNNALIELPNLQTKLTEVQNALTSLEPLNSAEILAVDARQKIFEPLGKIITRVGNAAAVSVNDARFSDDLKTLGRKLQGRRATPRFVDDPATPDIDESKQSISASQMSFDNRLGHFSEYISLLETSGSYNPHETDLQIPTLRTLLAEMQAKNQAVINASIPARNARIARDEALYDSAEGIIARANLVKKYVKSVFGADSPQYRQLTVLQFRKR